MKRHIIDEDVELILAADLPWEEFADSRILVTGAAGMLASYMVETMLALVKKGRGPREVIGLVRNLESARHRFDGVPGVDHLSLFLCDLDRPIAVDGPIDFIIHAASQASPKFYGTDPVGTLIPNVFGTRNILDLSREKKTRRVLFFSSGEVYGDLLIESIPIAEDAFGRIDPMSVRSCYAESKRMGENLCSTYLAQYAVESVVVRPFHTYGPGMKLDDGRVFADFVAAAVAGRDIEIRSDGSAIRAFCYIADATAGFFTAMLKGTPGTAYNVGLESETSILELAQVIVSICAGSGIKARFAPPRDDGYIVSPISRNVPNCDRIASLGWVSRTTINEGFARTVAFYAK